MKNSDVLVFQGGGALGAYQAGVYQALAEAGHRPDWIAGISIGAINAAIIAGNPPDLRVERLREFWNLVSSRLTAPAPFPDGMLRSLYNEAAAGIVAATGIPGFFEPRFPPPWFNLPGAIEAISYYDTTPLKETLERLVDFDRINHGGTRLSVGAVNVANGNFVYFDNHERVIGPEHIMASGALPPGFPPVVIDGEAYWDGGIVSNTPLQYVLDAPRHGDLTIFQVDLFPARGPVPRTLAEAAQREKDIRFSSRTRLNTDIGKELEHLRAATRRLLAKLPEHFQDDPDANILAEHARDSGGVTILHLINRSESFETQCKDYEFSRITIEGHWDEGLKDVARSLAHPRWKDRKPCTNGIITFDLTGGG